MWTIMKPKARHFLALTIFLPLLLLAIYLTTVNSPDYEKATEFISNDKRVATSIGKVKGLRWNFFSGFDSNGSNANYTFRVTAENGTFNIDIHLSKKSDTWLVGAFEVRSLK